jgi:hypothetical protein
MSVLSAGILDSARELPKTESDAGCGSCPGLRTFITIWARGILETRREFLRTARGLFDKEFRTLGLGA